MIRALHSAAVFTAIINSPPDLYVELGRTTLTLDDCVPPVIYRLPRPSSAVGTAGGRQNPVAEFV